MNFLTDLGAFPFEIYVSICETQEEFLTNVKKVVPKDLYKTIKKDKHLLDLSGLQARTYQFESNAVLIRTVDDPTTPIGVGVIAHEVFHAVHYVMDSVGIPFSDDTNEVYAYHIQFLMEKIMNKWLNSRWKCIISYP